MGSIVSIEANTKGRGDDLFLLSLLTTCLKVSRYPAYSDDYILRIDWSMVPLQRLVMPIS